MFLLCFYKVCARSSARIDLGAGQQAFGIAALQTLQRLLPRLSSLPERRLRDFR